MRKTITKNSGRTELFINVKKYKTVQASENQEFHGRETKFCDELFLRALLLEYIIQCDLNRTDNIGSRTSLVKGKC